MDCKKLMSEYGKELENNIKLIESNYRYADVMINDIQNHILILITQIEETRK